MATPPSEVRGGLAVVTGAATTQLALAASEVPPDETPAALYALLPLLIPSYYDAAGSLATFWYEELREESRPKQVYVPQIISQGNPNWIEIELRATYEQAIRDVEADIEVISAQLIAEAEALTQKEVARGFRDTMDGNARRDPEAIGWSRHARPGACPFCRMLARDAAVYLTEASARFAAHTNCHCVARVEFENGDHGPEADVFQYLASQRKRTPAERERLREHLRKNYPAPAKPVDLDGYRTRTEAAMPGLPRDIDAERTLEQLEATLAALEQSLSRLDSPGTRARIDELREKLRARRG